MTPTIASRKVDFQQLIRQFSLKVTREMSFFPEWRENLPEISEGDRAVLDRVQAGFWNSVEYPPFSGKLIQISVLGPLLLLAGFYEPPFHIQAEKSIEISAPDENGSIIRGQIDILVLKEQVWALVIEAKEADFSIEAGISQLLSYMLTNPVTDKPSYGLIASGGSFIFVKLLKGETNDYGFSKIYEIRNPGNDLYEVLQVLKKIANL